MQLEPATKARERPLPQLGHRHVVGLAGKRGAQLEVRACVPRVELHGTLEEQHRAIQRFEGLRAEVGDAFGKGFIGLDDLGPDLAGARHGHVRSQQRRQLAHQRILQPEDAVQRAIDLDRARTPRTQIGDGRRDANVAASPLKRPGHDERRTELPRRTDSQRIAIRAGPLAHRPHQRVDPRVRQRRHAFDLTDTRGDRLGEARAEPLDVRVCREIQELRDDDRGHPRGLCIVVGDVAAPYGRHGLGDLAHRGIALPGILGEHAPHDDLDAPHPRIVEP